ncbi:MAG: response regulator [Clostridiales bacterium]|nr:response regulator [Clostridiales bacterium]
MDKKIKRMLWCSFVGGVIICVIVFTVLMAFMRNKTESMINDVSKIYMAEINVQLQEKFTSIIGLRLEQVEGIIQRTPEDSFHYTDEMLDELIISTKNRKFSYLGFCTANGNIETIYGEQLNYISNSEDNIISSLDKDGNIVEEAVNEKGEKILLLGKAAEYEMEDNQKSIALIAGVSMEYLNKALFLENDDSQVYSHIISEDGEFIIRNGGEYKKNFFERVKEEFEEHGGKEVEVYVKELQEAIALGQTYSTRAYADGEDKYLYCSPISENTTWYLVTIMGSGVLTDSVTKLENWRTGAVLFALSIILMAIIVIFVVYIKLSQQQMKRLNEAKWEALHANNAKSEFLSSMSHDIRTPMNAILGMTEIALKNIKDPVRLEDCLRKVQLSGKHLLGLINDVLDMSKIESGKMNLNINQISLRETMDDIVNIIQPQIKAGNQYFDIFIQNIEAEDVYCDGLRLNQVLLNLLSNALKFTPEKGRIDVHLYQEPSPLGDGYVRTHFLVEDTGIGMSEEFQKKIFDSFSRENTEKVQNITGTGLGMAITKAIVDLMHGEIALHSELDKGSKFHITLDLEKATKNDKMELPEWNILVVDDNEQLCISAVANLEELGVHAEWTQDGIKAIQMIEERHKKNEDYRFVLIDWKMPNMDGIRIIREIRQRVGKEIPVFLISAYDWGDIEDKIGDADIEGFISKPLFKSTLYTHLRQYTGASSAVPEKKETQVADFTGKRILLAEDIDLNWEIANEILSSFGLEITRAVNGKECVEKFEESEIGFYDAVLMDIRMPVMTGYDATKNIRKLERPDNNLPIIAMTADAFNDDVQYCLDCGMNAHIAKPLDIKELIGLLQKYLNE